MLHGEIEPPELSHEERLLAKDAAGVAEKLAWSAEPWRALTEEVKSLTGKKGRELFDPLRVALTGHESGPEMAGLVAAMGRDRGRPPSRSRRPTLIFRSSNLQQNLFSKVM